MLLHVILLNKVFLNKSIDAVKYSYKVQTNTQTIGFTPRQQNSNPDKQSAEVAEVVAGVLYKTSRRLREYEPSTRLGVSLLINIPVSTRHNYCIVVQ